MAVINSFTENEINLSKIVSVTADGAPSIVGKIIFFFFQFISNLHWTY